MGLGFRLFTGVYSFVMMSVALFLLASGILGRKLKWGWLTVFCAAAQALQWLGMAGPFLLSSMGGG